MSRQNKEIEKPDGKMTSFKLDTINQFTFQSNKKEHLKTDKTEKTIKVVKQKAHISEITGIKHVNPLNQN